MGILEEFGDGKTIIRTYYMKKNLFSIKELKTKAMEASLTRLHKLEAI